eukprot:m.163248 g.163248  ORF g.163248 m.163248 type:complete len:120 (-) comp10307_c0_seq9:4769-5128(-)
MGARVLRRWSVGRGQISTLSQWPYPRCAGTMALLTKDATRPGVTVDLNASYPSAAKMGSTLRLEARCGGAELSQSCSSTCRPCSVLKLGRSLAFTEIEIFANDNLVVTGRHTKALPPKK